MSNTVPEGWRESSIGEIASKESLFCDGDWVESKDQDQAGTNRLIQLADVGDGVFVNKSSRFMNDEQFERLKCTALKKNDILIARMPDPLGRACLYPLELGRAATVVDVAVIRTPNADHYWLMSAINSSKFRYQIDLNASGTTRTRIARGTLSQIRVLEPPLPEQQKIATILSSVDDVIEKTRVQIDKLKDLKTGMMQELLTKGIGSGGVPHTEFKDSPVGRVPVSWEVASISEIQAKEKYSCVGGPFGSDLTSKHYVEKAGVPVIRGSNLPLDFRRFIDEGFVYVSEGKAESLTKNMAYPGDLVFTQRGTLGQVGLIPENAKFSRYVISQSQMKLRIDESAADKEYLYQFFLSGSFLRALDQQTIATGLPHINLGILKSFLIPLPPMPEQIEIGKILYSVDQKTAALRTKLERHIALKKALMQDLLTGKVRVLSEDQA